MRIRLLLSLCSFISVYSFAADTTRRALISVSEKTNLIPLAKKLLDSNFEILSTGGTYKLLTKELPNNNIHQVSDITEFPEVLGGRVKTLHPRIHGGLLADVTKEEHCKELSTHNITPISVLVCNLYPFKQTIAKQNVTQEEAIEQIDIGGPCMLRAAAKNFKNVVAVSSPWDYDDVIRKFDQIMDPEEGLEDRKRLARKVFGHTMHYDATIASYLLPSGQEMYLKVYEKERDLKYGCNSHQQPAALWRCDGDSLPFGVIHGDPSYINLLDACSSWGLVRDASRVLAKPVATSFKHTSPAGAGIGDPLTAQEKLMFDLPENYECTAVSAAFLRARNGDPKSSFGDYIAISDTVNEELAQLIAREVSDGIIASGYTEAALEILKKKKGGKYLILQGNPEFTPKDPIAFRDLGGCAISQPIDTAVTDYSWLESVVTNNKSLTEQQKQDLIFGNIALKYTQSNSIVYAKNGQLIGVGAGQQNRVDCVELAGKKADIWQLRAHPKALALLTLFKNEIDGKKIPRAVKNNTVMAYISGEEIDQSLFVSTPEPLTQEEKRAFLKEKGGAVLASDAFFPFEDNIEKANEHGVKCIIQPGGSMRDQAVTEACNTYNIAMIHTGKRVFTH